jgi:hypothetical protein
MMPRYFFNVHNSIGLVEDEEGRDFADLDAARQAALKGAREIIAEDAAAGVVDLRGRLDVLDASGIVVLVIPFAEAVEVLGPEAEEQAPPVPPPTAS